MAAMFPQDPVQAPAAVEPGLVAQLTEIGWVDRTALVVLVVFFVIGLFKGLIWQVSRVGILLASYVLSARYGHGLGTWFAATPAVGGNAPTVDPATGLLVVPAPPETTLYLAYVTIFLAVLVALSLLAILLQKVAHKAGLGFFDRLGGGVIGVATGACVVLFGVGVVQMFFRDSQLALAAEQSHSLRWSQRAVDSLGRRVPDELRSVFALTPLAAPATGSPGELPPADPVDDEGAPGVDRTPPGVAPVEADDRRGRGAAQAAPFRRNG